MPWYSVISGLGRWVSRLPSLGSDGYCSWRRRPSTFLETRRLVCWTESSRDVAARFDRVSGTYDKTRPELTGEALDIAASALRKGGVNSILEAGVGTGRIAIPLQERGFDLVASVHSIRNFRSTEEIRSFLHEAKRVVRRGGRLVVAESDLKG
jgi:ubiquinone/menaquinone biosynthesis C-methylase UbiE